MLLEDDTVVIGSPGSYNWKGNIFMISVSDDFLHRDKTCYYSPVRDVEVSPVESYSYLGNLMLLYTILVLKNSIVCP